MRVGRTVAALALLVGVAGGSVSAQEAGAPPALLRPETLLSVGRIVEEAPDGAVVLGSEAAGAIEDVSLTVFDRIWVPASVDGRRLEPGDRIRTFRIGRIVVDPVTGAPAGRILAPTGVAVVESLEGDVAAARIERAWAPVLVGDGVEAVPPVAAPSGPTPTGWAGAEGYLIAFQSERGIQPPYAIAFLRLSRAGSLGPGAEVELIERGKARDGHRLPDLVRARATVVRVDEDVAAAIVHDVERRGLEAGDRFRSVAPGP